MNSAADSIAYLVPLYRWDRRSGNEEIVSYARIDADQVGLSVSTWRISSKGYAYRSDRNESGKRRMVLMHRLALFGAAEATDERQTDHENGDRLDNRAGNLRPATVTQNNQNRRGWSSTGHRNVFLDRRYSPPRFRARVVVDGAPHSLGSFATPELAAAAAADFRQQHMPFAREATA